MCERTGLSAISLTGSARRHLPDGNDHDRTAIKHSDASLERPAMQTWAYRVAFGLCRGVTRGNSLQKALNRRNITICAHSAQANIADSSTTYGRLDVCGRVAQLVEQRPFKAWVLGSSPSALTMNLKDLRRLLEIRFRRSKTPQGAGMKIPAFSIARKFDSWLSATSFCGAILTNLACAPC